MFLRIGRKILNTGNLVDANLFEVGEEMTPYRQGDAGARTVVVTTTALEADQDGTLGPRRLWLEGEDADLFLEALPVYAPVLEQ